MMKSKRKEKQRDSLLENMDTPYNPFELLQTIDINKDSGDDNDEDEFLDDDNPFVKKSSKPRRSEPNPFDKPPQQVVSKKLKSKRLSAPPKSLVSQTDQEDLLGLFGSSGGGGQPKLRQAHSEGAKQNADPFSVFEPRQNAPSRPALANNSSVNSVTTEELFDVNMWGFSDNKPERNQRGKSNPHVKPLQVKHKPDLAPLSEEKSSSEDSEDSDDDTLGVTKKKFEKSSGSDRRHSAPANPNPSTNALKEMYRGTALLKYPRRHGFPHFKHVQLSRDNSRIQWFSKRKGLNDTCIHIKDMREILQGQKTEVFKKFRQDLLEKASFSIVYGHDYKTLDVVAKSTDECDMWVNALRQLVDLQRAGTDLAKVTTIDVGVKFKDRNRPRSRRGSGNFIRANNSRQLKIDPIALKQVEREMEQLHKNYHRVAQLAQKTNITRSEEFHNIQQVLSELEERIEELSHEVQNTRDTEMSKRDVWRANVDLTAIQEKVEVLIKYYNTDGQPK